MERKPVVVGGDGKYQQLQAGDWLTPQLRFGTGVESGQNVTVDDSDVCIVTALGDPVVILSGEVYSFTLTSNVILSTSRFLASLDFGTNTQGVPIVQRIRALGAGEVEVYILNTGGQAGSDDTNGTLVITIQILNKIL